LVGRPANKVVSQQLIFTFPLFLFSTSSFDLPHEILKLEERQNSKFWHRSATPLGRLPALWPPYKRAGEGASSSHPLSIEDSEIIPLFLPSSKNF
jgi:hypothetical protein